MISTGTLSAASAGFMQTLPRSLIISASQLKLKEMLGQGKPQYCSIILPVLQCLYLSLYTCNLQISKLDNYVKHTA